MEASIPSPSRLVTFWMRGAKSGVGSEVGVGTNFRPRDRTSVSGEERGCPDRFMSPPDIYTACSSYRTLVIMSF